MRIIPVIDILGGVAVHAIRGKRENYQPLKSILCASADPVDVAASFRAFGFSELYVADLDAIRGGIMNSSLLKRIVNETELKVMVDAGVSNLERSKEVVDCGASKVIIGTETLPNISFLTEAIEAIGVERVVVSLDLMGDKVLTGFDPGMLAEPIAFLHELETLRVHQIIVIDLSKVGSREGTNIAVIKKVQKNNKIDVLVGGGVRDITDLIELKSLGVSAVLVATALHSGKISSEKMKQAGLL